LVIDGEARDPLGELAGTKFPWMVSYNLVKLLKELDEPFKVIEEVRNGLIKKYGETDDKGNSQVKPESENFPKFAVEFNELLAMEVEVAVKKVELPEKVAATCDKCHHNMDKVFEIEATMLMALDKFVGVVGDG